MQKNTAHIISLLLCICNTSIIYFLSLVISFPFWLTIPLVAIASYVIFKFVLSIQQQEKSTSRFITIATYCLFMIGVFLLVNRGFYLSEKYGGWDAWAFWNIHAKFLAASSHWSQLFDVSIDPHPDYPLCLPGFIAFFQRLFSNSFVIPFAVSSVISIAIPVLIFLELSKRNLWIAGLILIWFATDDFYIQTSLSQCADALLAVFFLAAFIVMNAYQDTKNTRLLILGGALLGACIWTKNEGIVLALIFTFFHLDILLKQKRGLNFLFGLVFPLLAFALFKIGYAPMNDLVKGRQRISTELLFDKSRHDLIVDCFKLNLKEKFYYYKWAAIVLLLSSLLIRKLPFRNLAIIITCMAAYFIVYLLTPMDLAWQLNTSMDRLLLQLSPSFALIVGWQLSSINYRSLKSIFVKS